MPNGFRGNPPAVYLGKVSEAHSVAVAAGNQAPAGAPHGPRVVRLPHPPSTANSGSFSVGYNNSSNIVTSQSEYDTVARIVSEMDDGVGEAIYNISTEIEELCETIFVMPSTTPRILALAGTIKSSMGSFRSATEEMSASARMFASEIVSVG